MGLEQWNGSWQRAPWQQVADRAHAAGVPQWLLRRRLGLNAGEFAAFLEGEHEWTEALAERLAETVGLTAEEWLLRWDAWVLFRHRLAPRRAALAAEDAARRAAAEREGDEA